MEDITGLASARLMDSKEVENLLGVSRKKLWQMRKSGLLPLPVRLGHRGTKWRESDIVAFVRDLKAVEL